MSYITVSPLPNTTIMRIYSEKDEIQIDPVRLAPKTGQLDLV